jgi:hypothetical protein
MGGEVYRYLATTGYFISSFSSYYFRNRGNYRRTFQLLHTLININPALVTSSLSFFLAAETFFPICPGIVSHSSSTLLLELPAIGGLGKEG